jgi:hypothetical protein
MYDQLPPVGLAPELNTPYTLESKVGSLILSIVDSLPQTSDAHSSIDDEADDSHMSVMEHRPWTKRLNRRLRFRDILPQSAPHLPPSIPNPAYSSTSRLNPEATSSRSAQSLHHRLRQIFTTPRNIFGLFRRYESSELPSHDPEENITFDELSDIPPQSSALLSTSNSFYPYPNHSSFRLGDWYWNGGAQKSQSSFRELVKIIGDPEFNRADIRNAQWDDTNYVLGSEGDQGDWTDDDAGWTNTPITINVPYHTPRSTITLLRRSSRVHNLWILSS